MKRVAINLFAAHKVQTGIGTYLTGLIDGLSKIKLNYQPVLIINKEGKEIFAKYLDQLEYYQAPSITDNIHSRVIYEHTMLSSDIKKLGIDLLHSPVFVSPSNYKGKGVLTIHDTTFITHSRYHVAEKRIYFKWGIPMSVRKNRRTIAISKNTQSDLIRLFPRDKDKFVYIPYGIKDMFFKGYEKEEIENFKQEMSLPKNYFLYVGVLEPRKNIAGILNAFASLKEYVPDIKFVITGRKGWYYSEIFDYIKKNGLEKQIIYTGHVEYEKLPLLYKGSLFFIYPSFYEGFGMPVLEAMASGCPVITSNISSTAEIAGDACSLVDPESVDDIREAIMGMINDNDKRNELIEKGLKRSKEFSWEYVAKRTSEIYEEVLNG